VIPCRYIVATRRAGTVIQILPRLVPLLSQVIPRVNNGEGISGNPFLASLVQPEFKELGHSLADIPFLLPDHPLCHLPSLLVDLINDADRNDCYGYLSHSHLFNYLTE